LTIFKEVSEFLIIGVLFGSLILLFKKRSKFDPKVLNFISWSIGLTMASELMFTMYAGPYEAANMFGHFLKLISFYLIYKALIEIGLRQPYNLLFREIKQHELELQKARDNLEMKVRERTSELNETIIKLQEQITSRIKAEKIATIERQRFNDVLETLPVYVCLLTPDYYMSFANHVFRELFGYYHDKKCYEFLFGRSDPCKNCETYKVLETNKPQHWEWTGPNGRNYEIFDFPFKDIDGSRLILEMGIDITEQKQAERRILDDQEQLRALSAEVMMVEENERRKIAAGLHDSVGQILAFLKIELGDLQRSGLSKELTSIINHLREQVEQAIKQTRTLTFELSPPELYTLGLSSALEELANRFSKDRGLTCSVNIHDDSYRLSDQIKILLYRSVRELLINAAKHSEAESVQIKIDRDDNNLEIILEDDGIGFDTSCLDGIRRKKTAGFGLFSIGERLKQMGGKLEINSLKGKGTKVTLVAPLSQKMP
jgi:signal transduction histidine kinase